MVGNVHGSAFTMSFFWTRTSDPCINNTVDVNFCTLALNLVIDIIFYLTGKIADGLLTILKPEFDEDCNDQ